MKRKAKLSLSNRYDIDVRVDPSDNLRYPQKENKSEGPGITVNYIDAYSNKDMPEYDADKILSVQSIGRQVYDDGMIKYDWMDLVNRLKPPKPKPIKVRAFIKTDNNSFKFKMADCSDWLKTLDASEIDELVRQGWSTCEVSDQYAYWLENREHSGAENLFSILEDGDLGFSVYINSKDATAWMKSRKKNKGSKLKKTRTYLEGMKKEKALIKAQKAELRRASQRLADEEKRVRRRAAFATVLRIKRAPMADFDL